MKKVFFFCSSLTLLRLDCKTSFLNKMLEFFFFFFKLFINLCGLTVTCSTVDLGYVRRS